MHLSVILLVALLQGIPGLPNSSNITVIDGNKPYRPYQATDFDTLGPVTGNMLNVHLLPAINAYNVGKYNAAMQDFNFVIRRTSYIDGNPRQADFISMAHYLRGMIYLYHSKGIGRHEAARFDFEAAIKWKPNNYVAHLELSRVFSSLGFVPQAAAVIQRLLDLNPDQVVVQEAKKELETLKTRSD